MAEAKRQVNDIEAAGQNVATNVRRLRDARGISTTELSTLLTEAGRPIQASGITRIEKGTRRVDADDLVALAVVFGVHPTALLLPFMARGDVEVTGYGTVPAAIAWRWMEGRKPLDVPEDDDGTAEAQFELHAHPKGMRRYNLGTEPGQEQAEQDFPDSQIRKDFAGSRGFSLKGRLPEGDES